MEGTDDKLEEAENTRKKGNDFYKSRNFKESKRCYNQTLDLLASQPLLISGEKEKRDNLVLTAHLNLAACELKLGDSAKVIEHCNLVLQLDEKSIKAYFRRGQAYHNNKDYDLALRDYLEAEKLEPQNTAVRKQKEKLLANKTEACARVIDPEELDVDSDENSHEIVVVYEDDEEAELRDHDKKCHKSARHKEFIPASQFCLEHLPEQYRTETMLACVNDLISLTVLLRVRGSSPKRPDFVPGTDIKYPFTFREDRNRIRIGSGLVSWVDMNPGGVCPCAACKRSGKPETQFAEITIITAAHVIYDIAEARKSTCYFYYDSDTTDRDSCPKLSLAETFDVILNVVNFQDISTVMFVTHNVQLAEKLFQAAETYALNFRKMKCDFGIIRDENEEEMELSVANLSSFHEKLQELLDKLSQVIVSIEEIKDGGAKQMWEVFVRKYNIKPGKVILPMYGECLFDKVKGGNICEEQAIRLKCMYKQYAVIEDMVREMKDAFDVCLHQMGYQPMLDRYIICRDQLVTLKDVVVGCFLEPCSLEDYNRRVNEDPKRKVYDSSHPFTFIVSHPHGLGKKISLGEVSKRNVGWKDDIASYTYTNTTCPGSSGAPVCVIGRRRELQHTHPHSQMVNIHTNQSGMMWD